MSHRKLKRGVCRYCGCTEEKSCRIITIGEDPHAVVLCEWKNPGKTLCTNPRCLKLAEGTPL